MYSPNNDIYTLTLLKDYLNIKYIQNSNTEVKHEYLKLHKHQYIKTDNKIFTVL